MPDIGLITSKEIINKTGISETTLDNFIILGILPKPIVTKAGSDEKGANQLGYFPADVLERILNIKIGKQHGSLRADIVHFFKEITENDTCDAVRNNSDKNKITRSVDKFFYLIRRQYLGYFNRMKCDNVNSQLTCK